MTCRACGGSRLTLVFEMDPMPLAGAFAVTRAAALAAERYPLEWHRCRDCGLVNAFPSIPESVIFGDYSYRASDVPALVRHHREFAEWLTKRFPDTRRMLEVGGNDGVLLRQLPDRWERTNSDPSDVAADCGFPLLGAWTQALGRAHRGEYDLITSSNAFGHFDGLGDALLGVWWALRDGGHFVMEVHDLAATITGGQWDTVYHEHRAEWSVPALSAAGALVGLRLEGHERLPLHGGLIRAVFSKDSPRRVTPPPAPDFRPLVSRYRSRRPTGATAAYGAAARATVYLNQVREPVDWIADGSPRRAGRWVPGVGIPIISPPEFDRMVRPRERVLITAWTQADDIKRQHPDMPGEWVTAW